MKDSHKYLAFLVVLFSIFVMVEYYAPRPVNWRVTYSKNDKIPYGNFVLFDFLTDIFPGKKIEVTEMPLYNTLKNADSHPGNYIIINHSFGPDKLDVRTLLSHVGQGSHVFIAANQFDGLLADTLQLKTASDFDLNLNSTDSISLNFSDSLMNKKENYNYKKGSVDYFFETYDTSETRVLGMNSKGQVNYIKVTFGAGAFYLSSVPLAFTNYNLLKGNNAEYVFRALSYLPLADTRWDEYYKVSKRFVSTPLRYILNDKALSWAYFLLVAGFVIYIVFEGKRKQRVIPIISPLSNTTLEFVTTIGRLYLQKGSHIGIAEKKIKFLMEYIRNELNIPLSAIDANFYELLSKKTQIEIQELEKLFSRIERIKTSKNMDAAALLTLNNLIENFYNKTR